MRSILFGLVAASVALPAFADHNRHYYTEQGNYPSYCLEAPTDIWGNKIATVSPDCVAMNKCSDINVTLPPKPATCGAALPTYFKTTSGGTVLANKGASSYVDLTSREMGGQVECQPTQGTALKCVGPSSFGYRGLYDEVVVKEDGTKKTVTYTKSLWGRDITQVTPLEWNIYNNRYETGVARSTRVILEPEQFDFPKNYTFAANVSWNGESTASVSFNSEFFTHQAELVTATPTAQVFKVKSTLAPKYSPKAVWTSYAPEKNTLVIEDTEIAKLVELVPETKTTYNVVVKVKKKSGTDQEYAPIYVGPFVNETNSRVMTLDLAAGDIIKLYEEKKTFEVTVEVQTVRTGNKYYMTSPVSYSNMYRFKYSSKGSSAKKH